MFRDRKKLLMYVAVALVVVSVGVRTLLARQQATSASAGVQLSALSGGGVPASPSAAGAATPSASPGEVVVDVRGAVLRPGVYRLAAGSRICDLLEAAGGTAADAELAGVNSAAKLIDGQQIVVPRKGEQVTSAGGSTSGGGVSGGLVNLNTASAEQLDTLPGVGPSTAQKIIDYRASKGGFRSVEDLKNVSGIGDARFESLKDLVTV